LLIVEATISLDYETDNFIQIIIRNELKEITIMRMAHHIKTIFDYDKCMVMLNEKFNH
jgi:ABC-type multidrug transport system fused ATPase/permease subunit